MSPLDFRLDFGLEVVGYVVRVLLRYLEHCDLPGRVASAHHVVYCAHYLHVRYG